MAQASLKFPANMDLSYILEFARELDYYAMHERLTLDFENQRFFSPFQMLFIAAKIHSFRRRNANLRLEFANFAHHEYAGHMGFFSFCGLPFGRNVGEAEGGENYLPITRLDRAALYENPTDQFEELPDLIQRHADRIALVIARDQERNRDMFDALSYSIREVMRNVFEHSTADSLYYCTQYWPRTSRVEFALCDFGIGIRRGLGENPNFRFNTDKEALEYALLPSVSGKTHLPRTSPNWFNSGYGLYMTSRLARHGGNFVIASGLTGIHLTPRNKNNLDTAFPGTVLRLNFNVDAIGSVATRLDEFRRDGAEIAKTIAGSGNRPPSAMSLLLRRDYRPPSQR